MKKILYSALFLLLTLVSFAHEGEDHAAKKSTVPAGMKYFSSEVLSDKYEVLVKYGELESNKESILNLFLSDAATNRAIDSATITIRILNQPNLSISIARIDTGVYQLKGVFPANAVYDLQVSINGPKGADLLQVSKIEIGKELIVPEIAHHPHWYDSPWLWAIVGIILGLLIMYFLMRNRNRKVVATTIIIALLIPTSAMNPSSAHEGEDHGAGAAKSTGLSDSFIVEKDVTEAKARYEAAAQNLHLFNANVGRNMASTKMVPLTSPISGVIGTFNYAIGAVVNSGETLFEVTNLNKIYVEAQVFASDIDEINKAIRFVAFSNYDTATYSLRMVSTAQVVNEENQSQRVVFEILNPQGKFKIGENVRILRYGSNRIEQLVIPTASIIDVNGKPAVFIKDKAEQYSISFIQKGESNAIYTSINKGVEGGERVVTENVYQMKMIYLGQ